MRNAESERKHQGENRDWEEERVTRQQKTEEADEHAKQGESVPNEDEAYEERFGAEEILPRRFHTEPGGNNTAAE